MNIETVNESNLQDYYGLDIIAFHWAEGGACGEPAGVVFVTRDGRVCHTNYGCLISEHDLPKSFLHSQNSILAYLEAVNTHQNGKIGILV